MELSKIRHMLASMTLSSLCLLSNAQTNVDFNAYRAKMGGEKDSRVVFNAIMNEYKGTDNLTVTFQNERYDFYPAGQTKEDYKYPGIEIKDRKGLTIEGNGAQFIYHGIMAISTIDKSENITMRNFSIDWDRPIMAQCEIVESADDHLDVHVDGKEYPYRLTDGKLLFLGEGWELPILDLFQNAYDSNGEILYNTWDGNLGGGFTKAPVESLGNDILRFHFHPKRQLPDGTIIVLIFGHALTSGIAAERCKNLTYENLTIYHSLGLAIYGNYCENITEKNVKIIPNKAKGRVFSAERDANHFNNTKGLVWFDGCECAGQADDFVNVHGRYYNVTGVTGPKSIGIKNHWVEGSASLDFSPGEKIAFLHPDSGQREFMLTVDKVNEKEVIFKEDIPAVVDDSFYVENYTWTASFIFENCTVPKGNRARGILLTTPKKVIVRNNYFHSAGTAILIEGDINTWYESGACTDVDIYGNVFDNCLTSGNKDGDRWQWGDGAITITPSHRPADGNAPAYHRNIRIHNNEFRMFDTSILRACSVDGLQFKNNKVVRTYDYKPFTWYKDSFTLEGCRNVVIKGNKIDKDYKVRTISTSLMNPGEVKASKDFTIHQ